jgi:FG-GAP-like repeat
MKIIRLALTTIAAFGSYLAAAPEAQQALPPQLPPIAPPPLSLPRQQYYQQHLDEFQNLLQRFPGPTARVRRGVVAALPVGGSWTPLNNSAGVPLMNPVLLTDGTVFAHVSCDPSWYRLTPDITGSYINGTWTQVESLPVINGVQYAPRFFGSGVLPDGRVIVEGGEYNGLGCGAATTLGAIYDPRANSWSSVTEPVGWSTIGGAAGIVLPDGTYMQTSCCDFGPNAALLNSSNLTWTATGNGKFDVYDEEALTLLSNNQVLTVDANARTDEYCGTGSEIYSPTTGAWTSAGNVPNQQSDCENLSTNLSYQPSYEVGPLVMRPNGTAVTFSGLTTFNKTITQAGTGIYTVDSGVWAAGANIPMVGGVPYTLAGAPAAVLPNGNILFAASPGNWTENDEFPTPVHYFEMSIADNSITQVNDRSDAAYNSSFEQNLLVLPTGQIIAFSIDSGNVDVYTPNGTYQPAWQPVLSSVPSLLRADCLYMASGTQFNGLTEGAYYGDDVQAGSNFPLMRIVNNATGHVFYGRTFNHSTRSISSGVSTSTGFQVAAAAEAGGSTLYVVANGIPSAGTSVTVARSCPATHDFNADGYSEVVWRNTSIGDTSLWLMQGSQYLSFADLGVIPLSWQIVGQRDFNGDGKADLLWHDTSGNTAIWFMNGTTVSSALSIGAIPTAWSVAGTGDFNGDGMGDILWRDSSGNLAVWLMNGATVMTLAGLGNVPISLTVVGTGDFNGDGMTDLLWQDNLGNTSIWFMNGTAVTSAAGVGTIPTNWSVVGTGDFNGDGKADIVWRDTAGDGAIWLLNGATISSAGGIGTIPTTWSIVQTGDYNGDGMSDLLWRDTSGNTAMWFMNGVTVASTASVGNISTTWMVQSTNAE